MCGISGFVIQNRNLSYDPNAVIKKMNQAIFHRGPDANGFWKDRDGKVFLGHDRLSILDLSSSGSQPMISKTTRYSIVFNGEIYNHIRLRKLVNINNNSWNGTSDTETLLACIESWGLNKTLQNIKGMFAFALYDNKNKILSLARDRMGEKPLYYGCFKDTLIFSSELKAIKAHPNFENEIDRNSLSLYFKYNYLPAPFSIYKGVKKLMPGSYIDFDLKENLSKSMSKNHNFYWSLQNKRNDVSKFDGNYDDAKIKLEELLLQSVSDQMISDVPIGAFLSGGIDSSLIVSMMQKISTNPINTFSIGFKEKRYNEAVYSKEIAKYLNTNHTELYLSPADIMDEVDNLANIYDEPFSDSSQLPTYLLCKMTSKSVKVSLSGDAGDELFGGYNRYLWTKRIWSAIKFMPPILRKKFSNQVQNISPRQWDRFIGRIFKTPFLGDKMHKVSNIIPLDSPEAIYDSLISHWEEPINLVNDSDNSFYNRYTTNINKKDTSISLEDYMMLSDMENYLPNDILVKVDRAAMASSLETRVPFLDRDIIEFSLSLPKDYKVRNGVGKPLLREILNNYLPRNLIDRPKMGFGVPIDEWLRGPLKEWASDLIDEKKIKEQGYLNFSLIEKKWQEHISGSRNWHHHLWDVLVFQMWLESN